MGQKLAEECKAIFDTASLSNGSLWGRVNVFLPEFTPLIVLLSKFFPDKAHIRHMKVNTFLPVTCHVHLLTSTISSFGDGCGGESYEYIYAWLDPLTFKCIPLEDTTHEPVHAFLLTMLNSIDASFHHPPRPGTDS